MTVKRSTTAIVGVLALVVFLGGASGALAAKPAATFTLIDVPGALETSPREINEVGEIVGFSTDGFGDHGFLLVDGVYTSFDAFGELNTRAYGINPAGDIVGSFGATEAVRRGFLVSADGVFSVIDFPGASRTEALTISADGVIVGFYVSTTGPVFVHGFSLTGTGFTSIDVTASDVPGATYTLADSIAGGGRRAGWYRLSGEGTTDHGFLTKPGKAITLIDFPGATETSVRELSPNGTVVGDFNTGDPLVTPPFEMKTAFIWRNGKFIATFDAPGAVQTLASGINAQGQIVGTYRTSFGGLRRGYLRNP